MAPGDLCNPTSGNYGNLAPGDLCNPTFSNHGNLNDLLTPRLDEASPSAIQGRFPDEGDDQPDAPGHHEHQAQPSEDQGTVEPPGRCEGKKGR